MDYRQTKRTVLQDLADYARKQASEYNHGEQGERFRRASLEIADELERRATGERKPPPAPAICTDQMALWSAVQ